MTCLRTKVPIGALLLVTLVAGAFASPRSDAYREGQVALESRDWEEASRIFGRLAAASDGETDAALYWKAYADWKRKLKRESLEGLRQLLASYPDSTWADDAKALELEIRGARASEPVAEVEDEELKLYALDGLMQIDSAQAVPILEKLLAGNSSSRIKQRALFVLSQSDSPRAREILLRTARTGQPLELRSEAVEMLGVAGQPEDLAMLETMIRDRDAPVEVREAVVEAYLIANQAEALSAIARSDPDSRIRKKAIDALGATGALPSLKQLWATESDPLVKVQLLEALGVAGDADTLIRAARDASDPLLRRKAIEGLAISNHPGAVRALREMYEQFSDPDDRKKVLEAFMIQGEARTLIELFRAEEDPRLKKAIVQQLSVMNDPEATRIILELLGDQR